MGTLVTFISGVTVTVIASLWTNSDMTIDIFRQFIGKLGDVKNDVTKKIDEIKEKKDNKEKKENNLDESKSKTTKKSSKLK